MIRLTMRALSGLCGLLLIAGCGGGGAGDPEAIPLTGTWNLQRGDPVSDCPPTILTQIDFGPDDVDGQVACTGVIALTLTHVGP